MLIVFLISLQNNIVVHANQPNEDYIIKTTTLEELDKQLYFLYLDSANFDMTYDDFQELYIGMPIHCYEYANSSLVELNYVSYPIFHKNEIICLFNEQMNDSGSFYTLTQSYAKQLTEYYLSGNKIALIYDNKGCYIQTEHTIQLISNFGYTVNTRDSIQKEYITDTILTPLFPYKHIDYNNTTPRTSYAYLSVPLVLQGDYHICWAASAACISNYLTTYNYTAIDVAKFQYGADFNYSGGLYQAQQQLENTYNIQYSFSNDSEPLTDSIIYKNLINGYPVYAKWFIDSQLSHATVIRAISTDSYMLIMDPNSGFCVVNKSNGIYSYTNSAGTFLTLIGYLSYYGY